MSNTQSAEPAVAFISCSSRARQAEGEAEAEDNAVCVCVCVCARVRACVLECEEMVRVERVHGRISQARD